MPAELSESDLQYETIKWLGETIAIVRIIKHRSPAVAEEGITSAAKTIVAMQGASVDIKATVQNAIRWIEKELDLKECSP